MSSQLFAQFDDETVLRILTEATAELQEQLPEEQRTRIATMDDACASIQQLLDAGGVALTPLTPDRLADPKMARALLSTMVEDPRTRSIVEPILAHPPRDQQKFAEVAAEGAIILGALIAWLQTTIDIKVSRVDGKTQFSFKVHKGSAGADVIKDATRQVGALLGSPLQSP